jgi:hypothetical protein
MIYPLPKRIKNIRFGKRLILLLSSRLPNMGHTGAASAEG